MAIERMTMMNVVGLVENINHVSKEIVLMGNIDVVNAFNEIKESHFTLSFMEENVNELLDMSMISPIHQEKSYTDTEKKMNMLVEIYGSEFKARTQYIQKSYDFNNTVTDIDEAYSALTEPYNEINMVKKKIKKIGEFHRSFVYVKDLNVNIEKLSSLEHFSYTFGVLSKEDRLKLKKNYENISAIVLHTGSSKTGEVYLVISPKELEQETNRILRSLNFNRIEIPDDLFGTPAEIVDKLELERKELEDKLNKLNKSFLELRRKYYNKIEASYSRLKMEQKIREVKNQMVSTKNFFYFSGWVPEKDQKKIKKSLEKHDDLIIAFKDTDEFKEGFQPPTKLKNNIIFAPFEYLVKMYGIPSYRELDPTVFLGTTYMLLFGTMFGDLGQGFVLFLAGILLNRKESYKLIGAILNRLGISSMIFGLLYGSIFGFEEIIPAILIRPYENINVVLIGAIIIGIFLLLVSYIYSIANAIKVKNIEDGLFGRNGIAGLLFYIILLALVVGSFTEYKIMPTTAGILTLIGLIVVMIIKEPLSNLILGVRPLYSESISTYYIESSFDMLETLLSMLSNTVSFIRVGAFALTHVGLFIAFQTIAKLIGTFTGSIITLIIGNVVIICLEGLIVSIQGLRLEYYELFSKYYNGEGIEFDPIKL
ncbi:V-type ATP synthase subunit I [Brassicibacter mesophilus]|uniref:V-type ATP synthase subunit I n=1 Tax=Brassicibacter mesophilus TaxID=745119 RepID=UPI003D25D646